MSRFGSLPPVEPGYCHCGCGQKTNLVKQTVFARGEIKGRPNRFIRGHQLRRGPVDYVVDPESGCWIWQRKTDVAGYGRLKRGGKTQGAHRWFYEQRFGPVPDGLTLDHLCSNPPCVNPDHLEPVTMTENTRRGRHTKLTLEQARELKESAEPRAVLAAHYGIDPSLISHIRAGRAWADA